MKAPGFVALGVLLVASSSGASAETRYVDVLFPKPPHVKTDVVYGEAMNSSGVLQRLTLDVYSPSAPTAALPGSSGRTR